MIAFFKRARLFVAALLVLGSGLAEAHSIVLEAQPKQKAEVQGPDVPINLRFNTRIDAARSRLTILDAAKKKSTLELAKDAGPDRMIATAKGLAPGAYTLEWYVLSNDGHIVRGRLNFTVKP